MPTILSNRSANEWSKKQKSSIMFVDVIKM